jgi:murein DD-endopeptidase MepM/ murein hydrolase activator NlpD
MIKCFLQDKIEYLKKTRFTEMLIETNGLDPDDFKRWLFHPGMRFNSPDKWWGDLGRRDFPHEGVDFCLYRDGAGRVRRLDHETRIPVMHDGVVRSMFADYLGQAVVIEHEKTQPEIGTLISIYAHTRPLDHIKPGVFAKQGDIIATIADTSRSKAKILPHLHFTLGQASPDLVYEPFVWNDMRDPGRVALLDPLGVIDWPWLALNSNKPSGCVRPEERCS